MIGAHTCFRLLRGSSSPRAARWIYALYFFTCFAWQTCGQLIPGAIKELIQQLKTSLGYPPQGALPFAYNAIYAALFVIAGALLAVKWLKGNQRAWAEPLLRCTWITSALTVALAVSSLGTDTRPAMISVPLLMALCLGLGLWLDRPAFTRTGSALAIAFAATLMAWTGPEAGALPVAILALLLAGVSIFSLESHRVPLSWAGYSLVAFAVGLAWVMPGNAGQVLALGIAFAAAWLIGRNVDLPLAQDASWVIPAIVVARAMALWAPTYAAPAIALTALVLALLARSKGRLRHAEAASALAALVGPVWQGVSQLSTGAPVWLGAVLLTSAAALAVGARRTRPEPTADWRDALAMVFGTLALLPVIPEFQTWTAWTPESAAFAYAALGLTASIWAARFGRSWRPALLATLSILFATGVCLYAQDTHASPEWVAAICAVGVLLTMRALLPSISVPIATVFALRATDGNHTALLALAVGLSVLALFEDLDFTWTSILGNRSVAWAASLSSLVVLGLLVVPLRFFILLRFSAPYDGHLQPYLIIAAVLPLLWVRATRSGILAIALAPLVLVAGDPWIVAGVLIALTHGVERVAPLRSLLFGAKDAQRLRSQFAPWVLGGAAIIGALSVLEGGLGLPWALLMLLAASELLAFRFVAAALFSVSAHGLAQILTPVLIGLAFLERFIPGLVSKVLGAKPHPHTVPAAVLSAIALAGFVAASAPADPTSSAWLLAATLAAGAVLLNQRWLVAAAVVAAACQISRPGLLAHCGWVAFGAAALAAMLRIESLRERVRATFARLNCPLDGDFGSAFWLGSAIVASTALLVAGPHSALLAPLLATGALLLLTAHQTEVIAAAVLATALVFVLIPLPEGAAVLGSIGFTLCLGGALLEGRHRSALTWHHAGWALSGLALAGAHSLHHPATVIAWGFAAGCAVVMAHRNPALEWVRWLGLIAAAHVGLFYLGLALATGAPRELILPWVASASLILGTVALRGAKSSQRVTQRLASANGLFCLGMFELCLGLMTLNGGHSREAGVALLAVGLAVWALGSRVLEEDDALCAAFVGLLLPLGFVAIRRLAFGAGPDAVESLVALVAGAGVAGLARALDGRSLKKSALVARSFAFWWPLAGLVAAPWNTPWTLCLLLLAQSAHFAVVARLGAMKRPAALLSTVAFNAAMVFAFVAAGSHSAEYLLIPFGLSLLVLLKVFEADLAESSRTQLRAIAVTLVYGAAAFRPLTFDTTFALWVCVALCVAGVALGIVLRVRSYVYLGTAFMITTLVANLVRYGVREPRMGALFLSGLGLAVVGFMVLVTTRRTELVARYQRARAMLQNWEG